MNKKLVSVLVFGILVVSFLVFPGRSSAQATDPAIQALMAQIQALLAQIQQLQARLAALQIGQANGQGSANYMQAQTPSEVGPVMNVDPSQKFAVNDRVQSTFELNVRVAPGGIAVAIVPAHTKGTITGGPQQGGAYWWWQVNYDNGASGYSVGDFLEKVDVLVSETTGNKAPVLSGDAFVSPTSVGTNRSNWWRLEGTDPEGGPIIYKVDWGDGTSNTYNLGSGGSTAASHIFSSLGNFQLKLTATDQSGASVSRLITVNVINGSQTLSQPSTKFRIGDMAQATDNINVRTGPSGVPSGVQLVGAKATVIGGPAWSIVGGWWWNLNYESGVSGWSAEDWLTKIGTSVVTNTCGDINADGVINTADVNMLVNYLFSNGSVPAGVKTDLNGDGSPDVFDQIALSDYIAGKGPAPTCVAKVLTPPAPTSTPSITVISPNGGETYRVGDQVVVRWSLLSVLANTSVSLDLMKIVGQDFYGQTQIVANAPNTGSYTWTIPASIPISSEYVIHAGVQVGGEKGIWDRSDRSFAITSTASQVCGDINADGTINTTDVNVLVNYLFSNGTVPAGVKTDMNGDGVSDVFDQIVLSNYLGGKAPAPTCVAAQNNSPKIVKIGDISLPTSLTNFNSPVITGQLVNFDWTARDLDNDKLNWSVDWGDGTRTGSSVCAQANNCVVYATTHVWQKIGIFEVTVKVWDTKGGSDSYKFKVSVGTSRSDGTACGDINADGMINASDVTMYQNYIFSGGIVPTGVKTDLNGDGQPDVFDLNVLIDRVYSNGPAPTCAAASGGSGGGNKLTNPSSPSASVLNSIGSQLNGVSALLSQIMSQLGR